jgi:hypothetical protein
MARSRPARPTLRRTSVLALTAVGAGIGIFAAASPASADIYSNIRQCESGGNYGTNTGNGYYGAYQFSQQTWNGLGFAGVPSDASPATQDAAAAKLAASAGFGQWPVCGAGGGYAAPVQTYSAPAASRDYTRAPIAAPVADTYGFFSTANVGKARADVKLFQQALVKRHYKLKIDGQYGEETEKATLAFQKAQKLQYIDGVVGPETWKAAGLKPQA